MELKRKALLLGLVLLSLLLSLLLKESKRPFLSLLA